MKSEKQLVTDLYYDYEKFIKKLANTFSRRTGFEVEELIAEFNLVFCEVVNKYDSSKSENFKNFLFTCCKYKLNSLIIKKYALKRTNIYFTGEPINIHTYPLSESIMVYDNFVNNPNPIIQKIARIIAIYSAPSKGLRPWLRKILKRYHYKPVEISEAFNQLHSIYNER